MASYTITSKSGADLGTYEGETALEAYAAMLRDAGYGARVESGRVVTDAPDGDQSDKMVIRPLHDAFDLATGDCVGVASAALVAASETAGDTGAVSAYRDRSGVWQPIDPSGRDEYRRDGYEVRTVYVPA